MEIDTTSRIREAVEYNFEESFKNLPKDVQSKYLYKKKKLSDSVDRGVDINTAAKMAAEAAAFLHYYNDKDLMDLDIEIKLAKSIDDIEQVIKESSKELLIRYDETCKKRYADYMRNLTEYLRPFGLVDHVNRLFPCPVPDQGKYFFQVMKENELFTNVMTKVFNDSQSKI